MSFPQSGGKEWAQAPSWVCPRSCAVTRATFPPKLRSVSLRLSTGSPPSRAAGLPLPLVFLPREAAQNESVSGMGDLITVMGGQL